MLHIINKSPYTSTALQEAAKLCRVNDTVLLIDEAIYALQGPHPLIKVLDEKTITVKALSKDLDARGISLNKSSAINMANFVDLVFTEDKNISWY